MKQIAFTLIALGLLILPGAAFADDDCKGSPEEAVLKLPAPLNQWGKIICAPFGDIITANDDWAWSLYTGNFPVWIPSQLPTAEPKMLGNLIYFKSIKIKKVGLDDLKSPSEAFSTVFHNPIQLQEAYRLDIVSTTGTLPVIYLVNATKSSYWGVWCPQGKCDPASVFTVQSRAK